MITFISSPTFAPSRVAAFPLTTDTIKLPVLPSKAINSPSFRSPKGIDHAMDPSAFQIDLDTLLLRKACPKFSTRIFEARFPK